MPLTQFFLHSQKTGHAGFFIGYSRVALLPCSCEACSLAFWLLSVSRRFFYLVGDFYPVEDFYLVEDSFYPVEDSFQSVEDSF